MPIPPKKGLNFELPPEFASNPNISVGPSTAPMRQVSGWGQQFSVPDRGGENPASVIMAAKSIGALNYNLSPEFANNPNISVSPAAAQPTPTPISRELAPGGTSNGPIPTDIDLPQPSASTPLPEARSASFPMPPSLPPLTGSEPQFQQNSGGSRLAEIGDLIRSGLSAAQSMANAADARSMPAESSRMQAPGVGMGNMPTIPPTAQTQMGSSVLQAGDRTNALKRLIATLLGR